MRDLWELVGIGDVDHVDSGDRLAAHLVVGVGGNEEGLGGGLDLRAPVAVKLAAEAQGVIDDRVFGIIEVDLGDGQAGSVQNVHDTVLVRGLNPPRVAGDHVEDVADEAGFQDGTRDAEGVPQGEFGGRVVGHQVDPAVARIAIVIEKHDEIGLRVDVHLLAVAIDGVGGESPGRGGIGDIDGLETLVLVEKVESLVAPFPDVGLFHHFLAFRARCVHSREALTPGQGGLIAVRIGGVEFGGPLVNAVGKGIVSADGDLAVFLGHVVGQAEFKETLTALEVGDGDRLPSALFSAHAQADTPHAAGQFHDHCPIGHLGLDGLKGVIFGPQRGR